MLLALDIGNTNITLGLFDGDRLCHTARLATDSRKTSDQYAVEIKQVLLLHGADTALIEDAVICSVVPSVGSALEAAMTLLCGKSPLVVGPGVKTGLNIRIDNPSELGADLVAGAAGVLASYPLPAIVIDMGTATTVCAIDKNGCFLGGAIAAGVRLTLQALGSGTAALPTIHPDKATRAIGKNTAECMQSGIIIGTAAMIDGLIDRMEDELGEQTTVVATGGLAKSIIPHCRRAITFDDHLLLDGLYAIYRKNR